MNEVWGKVIFSQASLWPQGGVCGRIPPMQTSPRADTPPLDRQPPAQETATEAGDTHPTGMHSWIETENKL